MKKIIIIIFTLAFILGGCADIDTNPNTSKDISAEVSAESTESADVSFESSEASESFEESFEDISNDASFENLSAELSEDLSNDLSNDESKEADASSDVTDSSEDDESEDNSSSAPPVSGGDNGNESKPEDTSSSAPDVSEPDKEDSKVDVPVVHTHSYSATVKAATCTEKGYTEYKCKCGDSYKANYTAVAAHSYSATTVSPTCTEQGYKLYTCACGDSYKADYVKARGHMWTEWATTKEATVEAEGEEARTCWICKGKETRATSKLEPPKPVAIPVTPADAEWLCNRILELLNEERAKLGAPALNTAPIAHEMAMVRANELNVVFSHTRPDGSNSSTIYIDYNYNPDRGGYINYNGVIVKKASPERSSENIALTGYYTENSGNNSITTKEDLAVKIVEQFKASAGHWKDLTNPLYTGVGIGVTLIPSEYVPTHGWASTCIMTMDKTYG